MVIEFVESDNPQVDLVAEARELLSKASDYAKGGPLIVGHVMRCEIGNFSSLRPIDSPPVAYVADRADAALFARAPDLLSSLCNELEQLRSQHSVQAQNIAQLHEQEKAMRAAIEAAISWFEYQNGITSNKTTAAWVERTLRAAITPKGEQK